EIRQLGLISRLGERVEPSLEERRDAAAEHRLLAEEVGLGLLRECGLEYAGAGATDTTRVCEGALAGEPGGILVHREETGDTLSGDEGATYQVAWSLGRDHADVDTDGRIDERVADVEAVGEHQHLVRVQMRRDRLVVQRALTRVGGEHHDHIGFRAGPRWREHAQGLRQRGRAAPARLRQPASYAESPVTQIERVSMALRPVAEHGDGPA